MMPGKIALLAALAAATPGAPVSAQDVGSRPTREFVQAAAQSDQFEILEAQTALTQSANARIRDFASQMIVAHQATSRSLREATLRAKLKPPPMAVSSDQAMLLGGLQSLSGNAFDKAYARHQLLAHRSALTVEQKYAASGDTPEIRQAAALATPVISSHLSMAEQLMASMGER